MLLECGRILILIYFSKSIADLSLVSVSVGSALGDACAPTTHLGAVKGSCYKF